MLSSLPTPRNQYRLAVANLIAQTLICFTGATVRVTASGLGCNTWPRCHEGSFTPVEGAAPLIHQVVEFGNRLLTFVLAFVALLLVIAVVKAGRRRSVKTLSIAALAGIPAQAVVGGLTVLLGLTWWSVGAHMLLSLVLVFLSGMLVVRIKDADDAARVRCVPVLLQRLGSGAAVAMAAVTVTGVMVTGAGPHAGDARVMPEDRLGLDIEMLVHIHGETLAAFLALLVGLAVAAHAVRAPRTYLVMIRVTIGLTVAQALVGLVQFWLGVPEVLVVLHVLLGATVVGHMGMMAAQAVRGLRLVEGMPGTPATAYAGTLVPEELDVQR